jgi:hypothetical protein
MAKLNSIQKERFARAADALREMCVTVVSIKEFGLTIGLQYTCDRLKNHVRVFVAQCSPKDKFKFKLGVPELAKKIWNEAYIVIPVLGRSETEILQTIMNIYTSHYVDVYNVECRYL